MLSQEVIKEWATRWQTTELNVTREYCQHLLLASLYRLPTSEQVAFKGGTALRLAFGSPRFSEDLDFTANLSVYHLRSLLKKAVAGVVETGIEVIIHEDKKTSGGYLGLYQFDLSRQKMSISLNVSLRKKALNEAVLISSPLVPSYQCLILRTNDLAGEKIEALLARKKPRDFFDLYFLVRERRGLKEILKVKERLLKEAGRLDSREIQKELKYFLPAGYQKIASSLPETLRKELERL